MTRVTNRRQHRATFPVLACDDFSLWYGTVRALRQISCTISARAVTAIIGPSGCGKSSLLKSINRMTDFIPSTRLAGAIRYYGKNVHDADVDPVALRSAVGMVFQKPNPFPKSIYDNVAFGPRIHGVRDASTLNAIVETSLRNAALWDEVKDRLRRPALELSGGQQQRLCIARALAVEPDVLLMDEPASALDPVASGRLEDLIRQLKEEYTVVIVTHNMQQAARISEMTLFLLQGRVVEYAETQRFFTDPEDPRTEDYIAGKFG